MESYKAKKLNNDLVNEVFEIEDSEVEDPVFKIDFDNLLSRNKDVKGWIRYYDGKINYPIAQAQDNNYYLNRNIDKKYSPVGTIFMDYRNKDFNSQNTILYGHNMSDGTMFGSLNDIFKDDFFEEEENHYIYIIDKRNVILTYQVFSYYSIEKEEYYITPSFKSMADYTNFLNTLKKRSFKNFELEVDNSDKILTLSSCYGFSGTSKRKVIHAKLIKTSEE